MRFRSAFRADSFVPVDEGLHVVRSCRSAREVKPLKLVLCSALLLFSLNAFSQDLLSTKAAQQACGQASAEYDKSGMIKDHGPLPGPEPDKALVYLFQMYALHSSPCIGGRGAIVRFGIDGRWKGATFGNSFLYTSLEPGDHHVCANWQTRGSTTPQLVALRSLRVEPGRTYYYGVRIVEASAQLLDTFGMELVPLDEDEAKMLLESYPLSDPKLKH